jgi:cytochrome P450
MKTSTDYPELPRKANRHVDHIPGDNGALPILGDTVEFLKDYHGLINRKYKLYGPIYRNNALLQRNIALLGPEANEIVLKDSDKIFSSKKAWDPLLDKLFPNGLMLRDFDVHRFHRKVLQAAFKKESLQAYLETMNPRMRQGVIDFPKDSEFGFKDSIKSLLLNVAAQVFMGVEMGKEADKNQQGLPPRHGSVNGGSKAADTRHNLVQGNQRPTSPRGVYSKAHHRQTRHGKRRLFLAVLPCQRRRRQRTQRRSRARPHYFLIICRPRHHH